MHPFHLCGERMAVPQAKVCRDVREENPCEPLKILETMWGGVTMSVQSIGAPVGDGALPAVVNISMRALQSFSEFHFS